LDGFDSTCQSSAHVTTIIYMSLNGVQRSGQDNWAHQVRYKYQARCKLKDVIRFFYGVKT